ncbi:MAG: Asp-tRNA(Asn)/Glu-tRNA(Gln) amidotransferase subunit GatC [Polyangiaceae bacterium]|nr:Asp-tRNA(Asn)/Glu-tRNA(Gln) amidotransferase subunit GatC [Polyangiaceae bacterium]MCB9604954.1 Asp-tRNA(Asn)/Glu-tRNA(Gln) amidotransferase subunit GatC [Polyangiaceae bacterium]
MTISKAQVEHVARLARLELQPEEIEGLCTDLSRILEYVEALGELDTTGVSPLTHLAVPELPARADQVVSPLSTEIALREAPRASDGGFAVPQFVEEG